MPRIKDWMTLKQGDIIFENALGRSVRVEVLTHPMFSSPPNDDQITFTGLVQGKEVRYLMTEGLSHYAPNLTTSPECPIGDDHA